MDKKQRIDTNKRRLIKNIIKTFVIMVLSTLLALALDELSLRAENILMLYAVAVLIIITETKGFAWGACQQFYVSLPLTSFLLIPD